MPAARPRPRRRAWAPRTALVTHRFATDRRDVVQPGDRRPRQGPSRPRDRCPRRPDGPRRRRRRHPVPPPQPAQGTGGARSARPGGSQALRAGDAGRDRRQPNLASSRARPTISSIEDGRVGGVVLADGRRLAAAAVVLTTGTFLRGLIHVGERKIPAGRMGEGPAVGLAGTLERSASRSGGSRPGRRRGSTAAPSIGPALEKQPGDDEPVPFSALTGRITTPQIDCGITRTTAAGARPHPGEPARAPMYSGDIQGRGPRYCPSIEDKVVRFADRDGHQIFLEPEGLDDPTVYPNGISTSLPEDVQRAMLQTIPGLEKAAMIAAGLCDRVRLRRSARARADARDEAPSGPLPGRPDQRHDRLRGSGGAGACRRAECGAPRRRRRRRRLRPLRILYRRARRRPRHARRQRALSDVHLARGVPAQPAGRQRRRAPDAEGAGARLRRRAAGSGLSRFAGRAATGAGAAPRAGADAPGGSPTRHSPQPGWHSPHRAAASGLSRDVRRAVVECLAGAARMACRARRPGRDRRHLRGLSRPAAGRHRRPSPRRGGRNLRNASTSCGCRAFRTKSGRSST